MYSAQTVQVVFAWIGKLKVGCDLAVTILWDRLCGADPVTSLWHCQCTVLGIGDTVLCQAQTLRLLVCFFRSQQWGMPALWIRGLQRPLECWGKWVLYPVSRLLQKEVAREREPRSSQSMPPKRTQRTMHSLRYC